MPNFAANISFMFNEVTFLDRFAAAREAGFGAVEFLFPYDFAADDVAEAARQAGVEVALFNLPAGDWAAGERGLAALSGREADFAAGVETGLEYARALGCRRLHAMAGCGASARDDVYIDNLRKAAGRLAGTGITLTIEAINAHDMPGYFLPRISDAIHLHAVIGEASVRIQADLYHMQVDGENLEAILAAAMPAIAHVQIAGYPGRHEPDSGKADCHALFDRLDALGYDGFVGCEYRPAGATLDGLGWFARYQR